MATMNPFDLLGDDDNDDPTQLLAAQQQKAPVASAAPAAKKGSAQAQPAKVQAQAKLPSKPLPPAQAGEAQFFYLVFDYVFILSLWI